jgi:hypothetical protein
VIRRARPAAVVEDNPGTGASRCPAASARCWLVSAADWA